MRKFLSILLSSLLSLTLFFCNGVFAGGENKIVYVVDDNNEKYVFISTENIPKLVDLFQSKLDKKFLTFENFLYKSLITATGVTLGATLCYGASKIENQNISTRASISSGTLTTLGSLAAFFVPEYVNYTVSKYTNLVDGNNFVCWQGHDETYSRDFKSQNKEYKIDDVLKGFKALVCDLERISPDKRHRDKHNKEVRHEWMSSYDESYFDPCFSDNNEGIVINVFKQSKKLCFSIWRQGTDRLEDDYTPEGFAVLCESGGAPLDRYTGRTNWKIREERIDRIDDELFDKIFE